jgi:hypothetical protein
MPYRFCESDTVQDLSLFLSATEKVPIAQLSVCQGGRRLPGNVALKDLRMVDVVVQLAVFVFVVVGRQIEMEYDDRTTVGNAKIHLGGRLGKSPEQFNLEFADSDLLVELQSPMTVGLLEPTTFLFEGERFSLYLAEDVPFSVIKVELAKKVGITSFSILLGHAEIDDEMTIEDLGDGYDCLRIVPRSHVPQLVEYRIGNCIGVVPRFACFRFDPAARLVEIEAEVRAKWDIEDTEVEFATVSTQTGDLDRVDAGRRLSEIDLNGGDLVIRAARPRADPPITSTPKVLFGTLRPDGPPQSELTTMTFRVEQRGNLSITLQLPKDQLIAHAKAEIARRLGVDVDNILLVFAGTRLGDAFVLGRLRVGSHRIMVYLKEQGGWPPAARQ